MEQAVLNYKRFLTYQSSILFPHATSKYTIRVTSNTTPRTLTLEGNMNYVNYVV